MRSLGALKAPVETKLEGCSPGNLPACVGCHNGCAIASIGASGIGGALRSLECNMNCAHSSSCQCPSASLEEKAVEVETKLESCSPGNLPACVGCHNGCA